VSVLDRLARVLSAEPRERARAERAAERVLALRAALKPGARR
jgi:hypothetical protein